MFLANPPFVFLHFPGHLIGNPLALASDSYAAKSWVKYSDITALKNPQVRIIQGTITSINPSAKEAVVKTHDITTAAEPTEATNPSFTKERILAYDFFIAATGLRRGFPSSLQSLRRKNFLLEAESHVAAMDAAHENGGVVIVGGGAVGVEMAAELKMCMPSLRVTLVHSRDKLLSAEPLPDEFKEKTLELLREMGVEVRLGKRVRGTRTLHAPGRERGHVVGATSGVEMEFDDGTVMSAGEAVMAISKAVPSTAYMPPAALDEEGYVKVTAALNLNPELGVANSEDHFVAGDAARWSGIKRCGTAMHMGMFVANNMFRRIREQESMGRVAEGMPELLELAEIPPMMGIAVGKKAVSYWPGGEGTVAGEDILEQLFRDDLGFRGKLCRAPTTLLSAALVCFPSSPSVFSIGNSC